MTSEEFLSFYEESCQELRLPFSREDMLGWILSSDSTPEDIDVIASLLEAMLRRRHDSIIMTQKKLSRIPPLPEESADLLNEKARKQVRFLQRLSCPSNSLTESPSRKPEASC